MNVDSLLDQPCDHGWLENNNCVATTKLMVKVSYYEFHSMKETIFMTSFRAIINSFG